jgi:hypothetical protein
MRLETGRRFMVDELLPSGCEPEVIPRGKKRFEGVDIDSSEFEELSESEG